MALDHGANINVVGNEKADLNNVFFLSQSALKNAIDRDNIQMIDFLLSKGADINGKFLEWGYYHTPLLYAVKLHRISSIEYLLSRGADPDIPLEIYNRAWTSEYKDKERAGAGAFLYAVLDVEHHYLGNVYKTDILYKLMTTTHNINNTNIYGYNALHVLIMHDGTNYSRAKMFIDAGVSPNAQTDSGRTPLSLSLESGNKEMIKLLETPRKVTSQ